MNRSQSLIAHRPRRRCPLFAGARAFAEGAQITGAGATFPAPVYTKWAEAGEGRDRHRS